MIRKTYSQLLMIACMALGMACSIHEKAVAQANRQTNSKLEAFAQKVVDFLTKEEQSAIVVGQVAAVGNRPIPGGPGLATQLIEALNQIKPNIVSPEAVWTIEGQMLPDKDEQAGLVNTIRFRVINQTTLDEWSETIVITRPSEVLIQVGGSHQSHPEADLATFRKEVLEGLVAGPFIDPARRSIVRPAANSLYGLELRVKPIGAEQKRSGNPVTAELEKLTGVLPTTTQPYAFAPIEKNQSYEVVVYNDSTEEIAAALYVDGIDIFTFSEDLDPKTKRPRFTHLIIPPGSQVELPGWHQTSSTARDDNFLSFLVTEYGKGRRSQLITSQTPDTSVGAVTVAISRSFGLSDVRAKSFAETGAGVPVKRDQNPLERTIAPAHAFITIRYAR
jgi:hypothetical protein